MAITAFWALCTCAVSSVSYVATRTSGNMADCSQEHTIMTILAVRLAHPLVSGGTLARRVAGML